MFGWFKKRKDNFVVARDPNSSENTWAMFKVIEPYYIPGYILAEDLTGKHVEICRLEENYLFETLEEAYRQAKLCTALDNINEKLNALLKLDIAIAQATVENKKEPSCCCKSEAAVEEEGAQPVLVEEATFTWDPSTAKTVVKEASKNKPAKRGRPKGVKNGKSKANRGKRTGKRTRNRK